MNRPTLRTGRAVVHKLDLTVLIDNKLRRAEQMLPHIHPGYRICDEAGHQNAATGGDGKVAVAVDRANLGVTYVRRGIDCIFLSSRHSLESRVVSTTLIVPI
jgi:hypothetical protein